MKKYIYLDDVRQTPTSENYDVIRTYTVEETIAAIEQNDGNIAILSLDNDLGLPLEGYKVAEWLEEKAFEGKIKPIPQLIVDSANISRKMYMQKAFANCEKFWANNDMKK